MGIITIVGLGPGDPGDLSRAAWEALTSAPEVWVRTARHPTLSGLPASVKLQSFDDVYETTPDFAQVYGSISERVLELGARPEGVVYAVPGHPLVAERSVQLIRVGAAERGLTLRVIAGLSFIEPTLTALGVDALPGLQIVDGIDVGALHHPNFHADLPALVAQVYSAEIASQVKLTLMNQYPDEHPVQLIHGAGTADVRVESLALYEIDRSPHIAHLTSLYVTPLPRRSSFEALQEIIAHLRAPEGCPWDRKQTHLTLRRHLLEEAHETLHALDLEDVDKMREEFGDLLLQIVLHAQVAIDEGEFTMQDVIAELNAKLIRRHPHVFGDVVAENAEAVVTTWEAVKAAEREAQRATDGQSAADPQAAGLLDSVPPGLPALAQAELYQKRAAKVGFDWPDISGPRAKVSEEIAEIEAEADPDSRGREMGDLLFSVVNWARWLKIDPETALRESNLRFARRFRQVELAAATAGRDLHSMTLAELDALWDEAKRMERGA